MKKITLLLLIGLNFGLMSCSKNIPDSEELNAEKQLINQSIDINNDTQSATAKQQQCDEYETASSCFDIYVNCPEGVVDCDDVDVIITDKVTKKQIKGKGEVIAHSPKYIFEGYIFYIDDKLYELYFLSDPKMLRIWNKDRTEILHEENLKDVESE